MIKCDKCKKPSEELWQLGPYEGFQLVITADKWYCYSCYVKVFKSAAKKIGRSYDDIPDERFDGTTSEGW